MHDDCARPCEIHSWDSKAGVIHTQIAQWLDLLRMASDRHCSDAAPRLMARDLFIRKHWRREDAWTPGRPVLTARALSHARAGGHVAAQAGEANRESLQDSDEDEGSEAASDYNGGRLMRVTRTSSKNRRRNPGRNPTRELGHLFATLSTRRTRSFPTGDR